MWKVHEVKWLPMGGICIFGAIWVKDINSTVVIEHERVHEKQQTEHPWKFWFGYIFWPPARARFEAEAYAVQARARHPIDGDHGLAAYLSGPAYLWCCSKTKAADLIRGFM